VWRGRGGVGFLRGERTIRAQFRLGVLEAFAWRMRFVVLDSGYLQYYASEKDYDEGKKSKRDEPIELKYYAAVPNAEDPRRIDLTPITKHAQPGMVITTVRGAEVPRVFSFRVESATARDGWISAFEKEGAVPAAVFRKMQK
jgi:PH domain